LKSGGQKMSFFKELKEDIAQSVNELTESLDENLMLDEEKAVEQQPAEKPVKEVPVEKEPEVEIPVPEPVMETKDELPVEKLVEEDLEKAVEEIEVLDTETNHIEEPKEEEPVSEVMKEEVVEEVKAAEPVLEEPVQPVEEENEEVTVITKGTTINGGIKSDTSLVVKGTIEGDVECQGKLTITGRVAGNTIASEIYVNTPRLEGDINSRGIVKIDVGTVVIGNVSCTSVLVAGAVKGNIEVNGPVIVDSTAVVKGDIKAKSIQINSGAVIDGHCSLAYADVDLDSFFE